MAGLKAKLTGDSGHRSSSSLLSLSLVLNRVILVRRVPFAR